MTGKIDPNLWQFKSYARQSASWQAAAQRRDQHRRRTNALVGTASVDLSGPHEPTPMVGAKVGQSAGHYFLVLVIQAEERKVDATTQTMNDDQPAPEESDVDVEGVEKMQLLYAEVIATKADAAAAVQRLLARVRDALCSGSTVTKVKSFFRQHLSNIVNIMAFAEPPHRDMIPQPMVQVRMQWASSNVKPGTC